MYYCKLGSCEYERKLCCKSCNKKCEWSCDFKHTNCTSICAYPEELLKDNIDIDGDELYNTETGETIRELI